MTRQHAGAAFVAAGVVVASLADGLFEPRAFAVGSVMIWTAVLIGLLSRALPLGEVAPTARIAGACLAAIVVLTGVSVAWASDQGRAFEEAVRVSAYFGLFTLAVCSATPRARGQWIAGLTVGLGVVSVLAAMSWLQPGLLEDREPIALVPDATSRLSYPVGYWNGLGALIAVALVLLGGAAARAPSRGLRVAAVAAMPVAIVGLWFTTSRGALLAAAAGLTVLVAIGPARARAAIAIAIGGGGGVALIGLATRFDSLSNGLTDATARSEGDWMMLATLLVAGACAAVALFADGWEPRVRPSRRAWLGAGAVAAGALVVALVLADPVEKFDEFRQPPPPASTPAQALGASSDVSGNGRWQFWGEAVNAFESAPVAGIGAGAYEDWWARNAPIYYFVRNAHSLPLQLLAELGAIGSLLLLGFLAALALAIWRLAQGGLPGDAGVLIAVLAAGGLPAAVDWSWEIPAAFGAVVVAAALLTSSAPGGARQRDGYALGLGAVALAWISIVAAGLVLLTELKLEQSRDAAADHRYAEAIDRAMEARTVQPWSPEPYTQLALLDAARGDLDGALERIRQAEARDSEDWRLALTEARLHQESGDERAFRRAFDRALALNPRAPYLGGNVSDSE